MSEFKIDASIDVENLDVELLAQPELRFKYIKEYRKAQKRKKFFEEKKKTIRSKLIREINNNPILFLGQGVKPTDTKVEAAYRLDKRYIRVIRRLIQAEYEEGVLEGATYAMVDRRYSLEGAIELLKQDWFEGPNEPRNLHDILKLARDRIDDMSSAVREAGNAAIQNRRRRQS